MEEMRADKEIESFLKKLDEGLKSAERQLLEEKALHSELVVMRNENGQPVNIPAKDPLAEHLRN